eukprot:TRINITY_DN15139_c0_g1_i5.p1 TRINITY_DN15139_c0_g1~~TRINITY_DN15139_c0_g1_i5.p1  ORF type:complete len:698 (+),score=100.37 TRINITY_DN15139_c0_g1_i5:169-2262(+)
MGKAKRSELGIGTRLDPRSLDGDFFGVVADLKVLKAGDSPVKVPRFDKGHDERDGFVSIEGPLDILFYEGWRVGVQPGNFELPSGEVVQFDYEQLNKPIDFLMYLDADPEDVWTWKLRSSQQDHDKTRLTKEGWAPWAEADTKQLRQKWDDWMAPFLVQHEAKLMKDGTAQFVLTKSDAHHIVKTGQNQRKRLRRYFSQCKNLEISCGTPPGVQQGGLSEEEAFIMQAEDMMRSPGIIKATLDHREYAIGSSAARDSASSPFQCAVVDATAGEPVDAVARLTEALGGRPDLVFAYSGKAQRLEELAPALSQAAVGAALGCSSCAGVLVGEAYVSDGTSLFGLRDPSGAYVVKYSAPSSRESYGSWRMAGAEAAKEARAQAASLGKEPSAIFLHCTPGFEEAVLLGIHDVYPDIKVFGGSAADKEFEPLSWSLLANGNTYNFGVCLALLCASVSCKMELNCMHKPATTACSGIVTKAEGRRIYTIDGEKAGDVYRMWCGLQADLSTLAPDTMTTLHPLAHSTGGRFMLVVFCVPRAHQRSSTVPVESLKWLPGKDNRLVLMHPSYVDESDGSLVMFCEVRESWNISLVSSTRQELVQSAKSAVEATGKSLRGPAGYELNANTVAGAVVIYCAGAALEILRGGTDLPLKEMAQSISDVLPAHAPLVGMFPFGEQGPAGPAAEDGNVHANLMCNVLLFYN